MTTEHKNQTGELSRLYRQTVVPSEVDPWSANDPWTQKSKNTKRGASLLGSVRSSGWQDIVDDDEPIDTFGTWCSLPNVFSEVSVQIVDAFTRSASGSSQAPRSLELKSVGYTRGSVVSANNFDDEFAIDDCTQDFGAPVVSNVIGISEVNVAATPDEAFNDICDEQVTVVDDKGSVTRYYSPSNSWDRQLLLRRLRALAHKANAALCDWLVSRYQAKKGKFTQKLEACANELTETSSSVVLLQNPQA